MICYRVAAYTTPLRVVAASQPGRYDTAGAGGRTQYMTLHPLGPFAELMRRADLRTAEQVRGVRTRTWALEVPLEDLPEITFDSADQFGIGAEDLISDDHRACQQLAGVLRGEIPGMIVPSAALPGTRNVVLFGPRVAAPYPIRPVSPLDLPASITAEDGRPLTSLLSSVRFYGQPHTALDAWEHRAEFRFVEPDWSV